MKITFLGASHGVPEPNRKCSCTMIEVQGRYYFIDMGIMAQQELVNHGIAMDDVKGIFVTHMHGDHVGGLPSFLDLLTWYYKTPNPVICLPQTECVDVIRAWLKQLSVDMKELEFKAITPGVIYDDGFLKVTAIPTEHCPLSYAFLLEAEGKEVLFTGDLKHPTVDFPEIATKQHIDLVVAESAHFPVESYQAVLKDCDISRLCINHYSLKQTPGFLDLREALAPVPVFFAHDGLELQL